MEDGEIPEDMTGAVYHPSLEFPGEDVCDDTPSQWASSYTGTSTPSSEWLREDASTSDSFYYPADPSGPSSSHTSQETSISASTPPTSSKVISTIRLLVLHSSILPPAHTLAVLDGFTQIELGRDAPAPGSATPKVRLKEMEVSKLHATLFWDDTRREWAVVDMGSKHGTFVRKSTDMGASEGIGLSVDAQRNGMAQGGAEDPRGQRLSPPRVSSVPRSLHHLDELSLGSTTFVVHVHEDTMPCAACSPQGPGNEITLFHDKSARAQIQKRKRDSSAANSPSPMDGERDPKKALYMLKRSLLSRHDAPSGTVTSSKAEESSDSATYVDRSAKRRALYAHGGAVDAPGIDISRIVNPGAKSTSAPPSAPPTATPSPVSTPPAPLPSSNIGHRLLMKQGWTPGSSLGTFSSADAGDKSEDSVALVEPLEVAPRPNRVGLGAVTSASSDPPVTPDMSWQEQAKLRRWKDLNASGNFHR